MLRHRLARSDARPEPVAASYLRLPSGPRVVARGRRRLGESSQLGRSGRPAGRPRKIATAVVVVRPDRTGQRRSTAVICCRRCVATARSMPMASAAPTTRATAPTSTKGQRRARPLGPSLERDDGDLWMTDSCDRVLRACDTWRASCSCRHHSCTRAAGRAVARRYHRIARRGDAPGCARKY